MSALLIWFGLGCYTLCLLGIVASFCERIFRPAPTPTADTEALLEDCAEWLEAHR